MVYYNADSRLQLAREHDRPIAEMRRSRRLTPEEAGFFSRARLAPALADQLDRLGLRRGYNTPAFEA
jgi:hypothetical protein